MEEKKDITQTGALTFRQLQELNDLQNAEENEEIPVPERPETQYPAFFRFGVTFLTRYD